MVDVLAIQDRISGWNAVPVDRQSHEHGIHTGVAIQLAEIGVHFHIGAAVTLFDVTLCTLDVFTVHITERHHAHVVVIQEGAHVSRALRPDADDAERDLVGRSRL